MENDMENKDIPAEQKESRPFPTGDIPARQQGTRAEMGIEMEEIPARQQGTRAEMGIEMEEIPARQQESRPFQEKQYSNDTNGALIEIYLEALKQKESSGNYQVLHNPSTITDANTGKPIRVQALGAYGILDINWDVWSKQAGLDGADWHDPKAQDIVARYKVQEYFNKYNSWDLVSIAWFAGPNKAKEVMNTGRANLDKTDNTGQSIKEYVDAMNKLIADELMNMEVDIEPIEIKEEIKAPVITSMNPNERYAAQILDAITKANANGFRPDFESQVPEQAGSFDANVIKTFIRRNES